MIRTNKEKYGRERLIETKKKMFGMVLGNSFLTAEISLQRRKSQT
jgi:hypothetical protein